MGVNLPSRVSSLSRSRPWWLLAGALMVLALSVTFASITAQTPGELLDQQQTTVVLNSNISDGFPADDTCTLRGQTFTAGLSGVLSRVELVVARINNPLNGSLPPDLTVELWAVSGGATSGTLLASTSISALSVPTGGGTFVSATFPAPAPAIVAGTTYAVLAHFATNLNNDSGYIFGISNTDLYAGGAFVTRDCGAIAFTVNSGSDLGFRTFVIPAQATPTTTVTPPATATPCPIGLECATPTATVAPTTTVTPVATPISTCPPGFECAVIRRAAQSLNGQS